MTFSSMGETEMAPESDNSEAQETVESPEVVEEAAQLEQVTFKTEETIATTGSYQESEVVETGFAEVMQAAVTELPEPVAEKGDDPGDGPMPPYDPRDDEPHDGSSGGVSSGAGGDVMIDTVPLPESPMEIGEREMIGTWPTPEEPSVMEQGIPSDIVDRAAIIDTNDGPRTIDEMEAVDSAATIGSNDGPRVADRAGSVSIIDTNDGPNVKERVGPVVTDDSNMPPPTSDSSKMEIPEGMRDGPPGSIDSGPVMQETAEVLGDTSNLPQEGPDTSEMIGIAREGADDELKLVRDGDDDDTFDPGVDQFFDPHQDGLIDGGPGADGMKDALRGEDVGFLGEKPDIELGPQNDTDFQDKIDKGEWGERPITGERPLYNTIDENMMNKMEGPLGDVIDIMGEGNRPDPADLAADRGLVSGPQFGIDGTDLRGAASPGADQRASGILGDIAKALARFFGGGGGTDAEKQAELEEYESEGQAEEEANEKDADFLAEYNASKDGTVYGESSEPWQREVDVKVTAGLVWNRLSDTFGGGGASEDDDPRRDGHVGVRTPDPDGGDYDSGYVEKYKSPPKDSELVEALKDHALPEGNSPLDLVESMSQPVDEEAQGKERPVNLKESLDANLDQNINWGDDSSGGLSSPGGKVVLEPDNKLVDPPEGISGEGGGKNPPK